MTRDEAIEIMSRIWGGNPQHDLANSYVDAFVALGMLKLGDVQDCQARLREVLHQKSGLSDPEIMRVIALISISGLQIIEKQG
jgi:hypothetical protein